MVRMRIGRGEGGIYSFIPQLIAECLEVVHLVRISVRDFRSLALVK